MSLPSSRRGAAAGAVVIILDLGAGDLLLRRRLRAEARAPVIHRMNRTIRTIGATMTHMENDRDADQAEDDEPENPSS